MSDIAELGYAVDTGALVAGGKALDDLAKSTDTAAASHDRLADSSGKVDDALSATATTTRGISSATDQYVTSLQRAADANNMFVQSAQQQRTATQQATSDADAYQKALDAINATRQNNAPAIKSLTSNHQIEDITGLMKAQLLLTAQQQNNVTVVTQQAAAYSGPLTDGIAQVTDATSKATAGFSNAALAVAGIVGIGGIVVTAILAIRNAFNELTDIVDRGNDTRLGADMIMALNLAATEARVPLTSLNSALDQITKVSKQTEEDAASAYKALTNVGPAFATAFRDAPNQGARVKVVSDALHAATTEVQKYQIGTELLATQNDRVIGVFDKGGAAIDGYVQRLRDLGINIDEDFVQKSATASAQLSTFVELMKDKAIVAIVDMVHSLGDMGISFSNIASYFTSGTTSATTFSAAIRDVAYSWSLIKASMVDGISMTDSLSLLRQAASINLTPEEQTARYEATAPAAPRPVIDINKPKAPFQPQPSLTATKEAADEYDRLEKAIDRESAAMEASITTIGKSDEAVAKANISFRLLEAAKQANVAIDDNLLQRIQVTSDRYATAKRQVDLLTESYKEGRERAEAFLSDEDVQIAERLAKIYPDVGTALASAEAGQIRFTNSLREIRNVADTALSGFLSDLRSGKSPLDAFTNSLVKMSDQITNMALSKLLSGGLSAAFGGVGANDNSAAVIAAGTAAGIKSANDASMAEFKRNASTPGYGVGPPPSAAGVAGPNYALAGVGAVGAGVGAYQGGVAGASPTQGAESGALMGAMSGAALGFMVGGPAGALVGLGIGALGGAGLGFLGGSSGQKAAQEQAQAQAQQQAQQAALSAQQRTIGYQVATIDQSTQTGALSAFDLNAQSRRQQEASAGNQAQVPLENEIALERLAIIKKFGDDAVAAQKTAEQTLSGTTMSAIDTAAANINAARQALLDLGQSTDSVAAQVAAAVDKLRGTFTADLMAKINDATGKGYLNQISDLITETQQMAKDAATLGLDPAQVAVYFNAKAQSIVDGANLVGSSFTDLIGVFPQLNGVVREATTATAAFNQSIADYLASLKIGTLSPLSPADQLAAAQSNFDAQSKLAGGGDQTAMSGITAAATALLNTAQSFFASGEGYFNIYQNVTMTLQRLAGMVDGGVVGYQGGGQIINGTFNRDSVLARLAGGGFAALAGGEFVTRATSVNRGTMPILDAINRTGSAPSNDNGNFDRIGRMISMAVGNAAMAHIAALREEVGTLRNELRSLGGTFAKAAAQPARPGSRMAA